MGSDEAGQQAEPQAMTAERLADIQARWAWISHDLLPDANQAKVDVRALYDEVERLRAREAALVEVVRAVAASAGGRMLMCMCGIVGPNTRYDTPTWIQVDMPVHHAPDCVFAQARAQLAAQADGAAEAGERSSGDGQR